MRLSIFLLFSLVQLTVLSGQKDPGQYGIKEDQRNHIDALEVGDDAPIIRTDDFDLTESLKEGPVVLVFYRGYWCPYCSRHLEAFQSQLREIEKYGATVVAVTPEGSEGIDKMREKSDWTGTILHDKDMTIMADYGVLFKVSKSYDLKINTILFTDIAKNNDSDESFLPVPATYIIDKDRTIKFVHHDPNYKERSDIEEIIGALKTL